MSTIRSTVTTVSESVRRAMEPVSALKVISGYLRAGGLWKTVDAVAGIAMVAVARIAFQTADLPECYTESAYNNDVSRTAVKVASWATVVYAMWLLGEECDEFFEEILQTKIAMNSHKIEVHNLTQRKNQILQEAETLISSLNGETDRGITERLRALMRDVVAEYSRFVESETEPYPTHATELLDQLSQEINGISTREEALRATSTS